MDPKLYPGSCGDREVFVWGAWQGRGVTGVGPGVGGGPCSAGAGRSGSLKQLDVAHDQLLPVHKHRRALFLCQQLGLHQGFLKDLQMQKTKQFGKQLA